MAAIVVFTLMVGIVIAMLVYSYVSPIEPEPRAQASGSFGVAPRAPVPAPRPVMAAPLVPVLARRAVLSRDPVEHELLAAVRDQPADACARMVYADWLEERGYTAKANVVRGVERTDDVPVVLSDLVRFADHFERSDETSRVLAESDLEWRAIACRERADCSRATCPRRWDLFVPVADRERERRCFACDATVRYCASAEEARACHERGERAVVDLAAISRSGPRSGS